MNIFNATIDPIRRKLSRTIVCILLAATVCGCQKASVESHQETEKIDVLPSDKGDAQTPDADTAQDGKTANVDTAQDGKTANVDTAQDGKTANVDTAQDNKNTNDINVLEKRSGWVSPIDISENTPEALKKRDLMLSWIREGKHDRATFESYLKEVTETAPNPDCALRVLEALAYAQPAEDIKNRTGFYKEIDDLYAQMLARHPLLNAQPKALTPDDDISSIKRLGGGSSLVYRLLKDGETVAAFKPFQKRFQSNYRSEIAAYRLCPAMKCGFDVPENVPVYFDHKSFSGLYARNAKNPKAEFSEIIPTKMPDGSYRVYGTYKRWIPDYADYPIEFKDIWMKWLNPGMTKAELSAVNMDDLGIGKRHAQGAKYEEKLHRHLNHETTDAVSFARQISNLIVFDFLINNWDRFSGVKNLYGVNCQIADGRFMSIDNGASFSQTANEKPAKHLGEIQRFSRVSYEAIKGFEKEPMLDYLFPEATTFEREKFETFWNQRQKYLDYVQSCVEKNGESETFFFE